MAEGFRIASAWVEIAPDTTGFREKAQSELDEAAAGLQADAKLGLDKGQFDAGIQTAKGDLDDFDGHRAEAVLGANKDEVDDAVKDAKADLDDFDGHRAEAVLGANKDEVDDAVRDAKAKLDDFDGERAEATLGADDAPLDADLADAQAKLDAFKAANANASIGGGGAGGGGGGGDLSGGGEGGGSLIGALTMGVSTLLPGIGGAVAGLGLLGGTGLAAFGGVGKALSAHSQASQTVGQTSQELAATSFSNSVAIQQAQLAVGQAYRQSAEDATMSAEQTESAQTQLAETVRNAAQAQTQAEEAVTQAQQQAQQATFSLSQAQYNLSDAWIQARYNLQQLNDQERDSATTIQAAQVALEQAQYQQQLTDENAMSTQLDRAQAAVQVAQAQEALTQAQQQAVYVGQEANLQDKAGVAGSQEVVSAKEAVKVALEGVKDANQQVVDAERNLADTEKNNAAQIQQAMLAVTQAEQQSAYQQQQDALAVTQAQKNLTDTYKEQRLEAASTASTSNQAANQFVQDMGRLTPSARAFVRELLSMHGAWTKITSIAQDAVMPGMVIFLQGIKGILPDVDQGVRQMGDAMSASFGGFGKLMQTAAFKDGLAGLLRNGVQFTQIVLPAFAQFLQMLGQIGGKQGAVTGLANLLAGIARGLTGLAGGLRPYMGQINSFLSAVGVIIAQIGPPLARMIGLVAQALGPLTGYLDRHPNGTVAKIIGDIIAGLITLKGLQKILPDFITGPLESLAGKAGSWGSGIAKSLGGKLLSGVKTVGGQAAGLLSSAFEKSGQVAFKVFSDDGLIAQGFGAVKGYAVTAGGWVAGFGSKVGSTMVTAGGAVVNFVTTMASQLAKAAIATGIWIGEHAAATAAFIAENVAQIASATAAFIAENVATLGIAAAITALIAIVVLLATHWQQVWSDVKHWAEDAWNFIWDGFKEYLLPLLGSDGMITTALHDVQVAWSAVWGAIKTATSFVLGEIRTGISDFVAGAREDWDLLETIFKTPVNFLIGTVYDDGIRRFWNDVVGAVGLSSLKLPEIPKLAKGGIVPGQDHGVDSQLVMMRPGEGVLTPEAVQTIGPGTVHALNQNAGSGSGQSGSSKSHAGKMASREVRRHVMRLGEHALGFSGGGILGDIGSALTGIGHDIVSSAKFADELATNPTGAVTSLLDKAIGTDATGNLAKVMTAIPKTLVTDLASLVGLSAAGGGKLPGGSSGAVGELPANWKTIATFLASHGFTKAAAAGVAGNIMAESGGNPEILQIGGGGGGGLIQWTPYPPGYITGDYERDLMVQLNAILSWGGGPGLVNRSTSPSNAALVYQDYYERPASLTASLPIRMASANAVARAMGWGKFDTGGWLQPGTLPVNQTGRPEAVLTPQQSEAFVAIAQRLTAQGTGQGPAAGAAHGPVNFNYFGPQAPTPEMKAQMMRDLTLAMSGATP